MVKISKKFYFHYYHLLLINLSDPVLEMLPHLKSDLCNSQPKPETHRAPNLELIVLSKSSEELCVFVLLGTSDRRLTNGGLTKSVLVTLFLHILFDTNSIKN